jgi:hypothetical protein
VRSGRRFQWLDVANVVCRIRRTMEHKSAEGEILGQFILVWVDRFPTLMLKSCVTTSNKWSQNTQIATSWYA